MIPLETLGRVTTRDGKELVLYERDGYFYIRVDGLELMSSHAHGSEEALARLAAGRVEGRRAPRILMGGLGMGYTLRSALSHFPRQARILVAEVFPAVVEWNRGPLSHLAGHPLKDPRVRVVEEDVGRTLRHDGTFDVVLLDTDNGPEAFTQESNEGLYTPAGLGRIRASLTPGGVLAVWSAEPHRGFLRRLRRVGFRATAEEVPARQGRRGPRHTIFLAQVAP